MATDRMGHRESSLRVGQSAGVVLPGMAHDRGSQGAFEKGWVQDGPDWSEGVSEDAAEHSEGGQIEEEGQGTEHAPTDLEANNSAAQTKAEGY